MNNNGGGVVLSPLQSSRRVLNFESEKSANLASKLNEVVFPKECNNAPWFSKNKVTNTPIT